MIGANQRKLKNFLLFPKVQLLFVFLTLLSLISFLGLALYQINLSFEYIYNASQTVNLATDHPLVKILNFQQNIIQENLIIVFIGFMLFIIPVTIIVSHRALGPFFRITEFFKNYQPGSGQKIKFRDKDYLKEVADQINKSLN